MSVTWSGIKYLFTEPEYLTQLWYFPRQVKLYIILCGCTMISEPSKNRRLKKNISNPFPKVVDLAVFLPPIIFKPYCVSRGIQSVCFCFFKTLLFCKIYLMSQTLMSLNKAIWGPKESCVDVSKELMELGPQASETSRLLYLTNDYQLECLCFSLCTLMCRHSYTCI